MSWAKFDAARGKAKEATSSANQKSKDAAKKNTVTAHTAAMNAHSRAESLRWKAQQVAPVSLKSQQAGVANKHLGKMQAHYSAAESLRAGKTEAMPRGGSSKGGFLPASPPVSKWYGNKKSGQDHAILHGGAKKGGMC